MVKQISLKELQRVVARERAKIASLSKRKKLELELKQLRGAGRSDVGGRIKRGFVILSKKAGSAALKQARLIKERQLQQAKKPKRKMQGGGFDPMGSLDF